MNAMSKRRLALVQRGRRVSQRVSRSRADDVLESRAGDGAAVRIVGDGQVDDGLKVRRAGAGGKVPTAPHHGVAARHEEGIGQSGRVGDRTWVSAAGEAAEGIPSLVAAVGRLVHHLVVALAQVNRLEDVEGERILDVAVGVRRREANVGDDRVLGIGGIHFAVGHADEFFVLSDARPHVAAKGGRFLGGNDDLGDARAHGKRTGNQRNGDDGKATRMCTNWKQTGLHTLPPGVSIGKPS